MPSVGSLLPHIRCFETFTEAASFKPRDAVVIGHPDNDEADTIFLTDNWRSVCCRDLLTHPTSVRFLTREGLTYFLPAIVVSVRWGLENAMSQSASQLFDHTESSINWLFGDWKHCSSWCIESFQQLELDVDKAKLADE